MNGQFQWADSLSSLYLCWRDFAQDSRLQVWRMEESWVVWWSLLVWMKWNRRPCCFGSCIILALVTLFLQVLQFPIRLFPFPLIGACHYRVTWKRNKWFTYVGATHFSQPWASTLFKYIQYNHPSTHTLI